MVAFLIGTFILILIAICNKADRDKMLKMHDADSHNTVKSNDWYREQERLKENLNK